MQTDKNNINSLEEKNKENILFALDDCSGCTDERSEGTHQMWSKQHFFEWYIEPYFVSKSDITTHEQQARRDERNRIKRYLNKQGLNPDLEENPSA